jgi:hypothetical protein
MAFFFLFILLFLNTAQGGEGWRTRGLSYLIYETNSGLVRREGANPSPVSYFFSVCKLRLLILADFLWVYVNYVGTYQIVSNESDQQMSLER